jgi:cholesterol transport system auxiliary component
MRSSGLLRLAGLAGAAMFLSACMLGGQPAPVTIMAPDVTVSAPIEAEAVDWSLQVQRPVADQMRDSERLLVRRTPSRLQVYPGAAWLDSVPEMLQSMMIRTLTDSGRFDGIGRGGGLRARYRLVTEIRAFEAVDDGSANLGVELVVQSSLVHQRSSRQVANHTFRHFASSRGKDIGPLIETWEGVLNEFLLDLAAWVLEEGAAADAELERWEDEGRRRWHDRAR